jgi:16S rRNA (adenine1518-N6/adenine1519-N6)-dimethyltransferase
VRPRRRFAQHFLEPAWVAKLVAAIEPSAADRLIEIGPGRGAITVPLAGRVSRLAAIEVDRDLAAALRKRALPNVTVIEADVLAIDLARLAGEALQATRDAPARVVGNLPYNIATPILIRLLEASRSHVLADATLMVQKEVADRLTATAGSGEYGPLAITAGLWADAATILQLPPGAFRPAPQVRSSVVSLRFREPPAGITHPDLVVEIARSVFTQRRKMLSNALAAFAGSRGLDAALALARAGLDPRRRPETLSLGEVARLADVLAR